MNIEKHHIECYKSLSQDICKCFECFNFPDIVKYDRKINPLKDFRYNLYRGWYVPSDKKIIISTICTEQDIDMVFAHELAHHIEHIILLPEGYVRERYKRLHTEQFKSVCIKVNDMLGNGKCNGLCGLKCLRKS